MVPTTNTGRRARWSVAFTKLHGHLPTNKPHLVLNCRYCGIPCWVPVEDIREGKTNSVFHCCEKLECKREEKYQDELDRPKYGFGLLTELDTEFQRR